MLAILRQVTIAASLVFSLPAIAAEPVRQIGIYVRPFYEAARGPGERPRVAVGSQYNDLLASSRREDILAARDLILAKPALVTPMTMMVLAIRLYDVGLRDDAVFWFYVAKDRYIVLSEVLNVKTPQLAQADDAVRNFATLAGPVINGYAFCDLARQKAANAKAVEWVEANPYEVMFRPDARRCPAIAPLTQSAGLPARKNAPQRKAPTSMMRKCARTITRRASVTRPMSSSAGKRLPA